MYENLGSPRVTRKGGVVLLPRTTFVRKNGPLDRKKVGTLRYHGGDDNGNVKKAIG